MKPQWKSLADPFANAEYENWSLKNILLTTFESVDTKLLVETLLPEWLGISSRQSEEKNENDLFLSTIYDNLNRLENAVIVSSNTLNEPNQPYPWLWGKERIVPIKIGRLHDEKQHSKLWFFHREHNTNDAKFESLEICISSTNLTSSAFQDQSQAAWRCVVKLEKQEINKQTDSWGVLSDFITALGASANKPEILKPFTDILGRFKCPENITFVASVPGHHSKDSKWGSFGLKTALNTLKLRQPKVTVLCPTIGSWEEEGITNWCKLVGCPLTNINLGWISKTTANNYSGWERNWTLPIVTARSLAGRIFEIWPHGEKGKSTPFIHNDQLDTDKRWLHAKLYGFSLGHKHKVLITSANFSPSAWGITNEKMQTIFINNFELGVIIDAKISDIFKPNGQLKEQELHIIDTKETRLESIWAEAVWDGKTITLSYRSGSTLSNCVITLLLDDGTFTQRSFNSNTNCDVDEFKIEWVQPGIPTSMVVTFRKGLGDITQFLPILDWRNSIQAGNEVFSFSEKIDSNELQTITDELLFDRFGVASTNTRYRIKGTSNGSGTSPSDYRTDWLKECRKWSLVVDSWIFQGEDKKDAELLLKAFARLKNENSNASTVGLTIAIDELEALSKGGCPNDVRYQ